jgi:transcriptional regulator with XRE-family HTH domain
MENAGQHIPNRLRKHRKLMGYTQKQVCFLLGIASTDRISHWEKGIAMPSVANLIKLSIIYHVFPTDLYYDFMKVLRHELEERKRNLCLKDISKSNNEDY